MKTTADLDAFLARLRSTDARQVSDALREYQHADAMTRHGVASPLRAHEDEVLSRAREAITPGEAPDSLLANALLVLMNSAETRDISAIVAALRRRSDEVRAAACLAASNALRLGAPDDELVPVLRALATDATVASEYRVAALSAVGNASSERAADVLVSALSFPELRLQIEAAWSLLRRDDASIYRQRVATVVASWPADPPYPANEVLELLESMP